MKKSLILPVVAAVLVIVALVGTYAGMSIHYHNGFIAQQNNLQARYDANRAELAKYARQIETEMGVAGAASAQLDKILQDAVSGRYNLQNDRASVNGQPSLFSAIMEAYPNLDQNQKLYSQILQDVRDDEAQFQNDQGVLAQQSASFDTALRSAPGSWFSGGYPTNELWAYSEDSAGNLTKVYGEQALVAMRSLVTSGESNGAYGSGTFNGPTLPGTPSSTPSH